MRCEVCGRSIEGKPFRIRLEGARLVVCSRCTKLGTPERIERHIPGRVERRVVIREDLELAPNYGQRIRRARVKLGMSQEELAQRLGEKLSVLRRLEQERVSPSLKLATKIGHVLRIKLLVPRVEPRTPHTQPKREFSLADLAKVRKGEET
ncbi:MAG: multiprotein bridging factor aMBF1 [Candidatus Bathyarchaeia archaeon]